MHDLERLYEEDGRHAEAESFYKRSLAIYEHSLGANDGRVAMNLSNLGELYRIIGRYKDAKALLKHPYATVHVLRRRVVPDHDPYVVCRARQNACSAALRARWRSWT